VVIATAAAAAVERVAAVEVADPRVLVTVTAKVLLLSAALVAGVV
jgi:hypothetical protein